MVICGAVDALDPAALEVGDEASEPQHVEDLVFEAPALRLSEKKISAPGFEGACLRSDVGRRVHDTDLGRELRDRITREHADAPEPEAIVGPEAKLLYLDKGRGDIGPREEQQRALGRARSLKARAPIVRLKQEGVHLGVCPEVDIRAYEGR